MEYRKLIAVSGLHGLFELVGSKKDGAIVRNLDDDLVKFVSARKNAASSLETIEVFTTDENVRLIKIFQAMDKSNEALPDEKDPKAVKEYFMKVYPNLDFEKVYNSDMKKMVKWFAIIKRNEVELYANEETETDEPNAEEAINPEPSLSEATQSETAPSEEAKPAVAKKEDPASAGITPEAAE